MSAPEIVILGLSLSSSWGNGHATTYRGLIRGLGQLGARVLFLERDVPWYAQNRDLPDPDFCELRLYSTLDQLESQFGEAIRGARAVIVGSYVPDGVAVIDLVVRLGCGQLCFYDIDTPVTLAKLEKGDEEYLARRQLPLFETYFSFAGGPTLRRLEQVFDAQHAAPLYCSVDAEGYRHTGETPQWDLGYLGTYSPDRQPVLEQLLLEPARRLPNRRFVVAGPQYPSEIAWPDNVERIEHIAPADHPAFYSRQRFTLNVTRADMVRLGWAPSVRLFEAAACATPVISDHWPGLTSLFPDGEAILVARGPDDVVAALTRIDDHARRAIAARARDIVLAGHTGRVRAAELLAELAGRGERRGPASQPGQPGRPHLHNHKEGQPK